MNLDTFGEAEIRAEQEAGTHIEWGIVVDYARDSSTKCVPLPGWRGGGAGDAAGGGKIMSIPLFLGLCSYVLA